MAESIVTLLDADNGRELDSTDVQRLGQTAGLADDRVLAELLRMEINGVNPVTRGILPFAIEGRIGGEMGGPSGGAGTNSMANPGVIIPNNTGARALTVAPFRAIIGQRTGLSVDGKKEWQDIRSALSVTGQTTTYRVINLSSNASGQPRWDLVYAAVTVDANVGETRFKKDPTTEVVTSGFYTTEQLSTMVIGVVVGTPGATPAFPALPNDAAGVYYVQLAYVRVVNGATAFVASDIFDVSTCFPISRAMGTVSCRPATGVSQKIDQGTGTAGTLFTRIAWPASGNRPGPFIPPQMMGGEQLIFGFQLGNAITKAPLSGDVVDASRDWRGRIFTWFVGALGGSTSLLCYDPAINPANLGAPTARNTAGRQTFGMGNSCNLDAGADFLICDLDNGLAQNNLTQIAVNSQVRLWVDHTTGFLYTTYTGSPDAQLFFWLMATGQFCNK